MKLHKLFPKIKPYRHGYIDVGDGHKLYYELCGNPKGKPVLYVHGGPGAGCDVNSRRFFNPKVWNIILFDQRGANRSKPFASLKANTTWKLVSDIRQLVKFLSIKKVFLFGGSWGSTLSLVYAIKYPETVAGMLLRGIFLGRRKGRTKSRVVIVEYPQKGRKTFGFLTNSFVARDGKSYDAVLIPTVPNPTNGFLAIFTE
ncbi:alpha/beta fold hydrolase, partial [Candidatus Woesearchaeota archaeon]|nr:alpha/beta fold hydrolase [Candidatus Woesearchaeota archaeon]